MKAGFAGFKELLERFNILSTWAAGSVAAVVPVAAYLSAISPPWPPGIVIITSITELVALCLVYQVLKDATKTKINIILWVSTCAIAIVSVAYLTLNSFFTFVIPTTKERSIKGFTCSEFAESVYEKSCPNLGTDELETAKWSAETLWTIGSITVVRDGLVILWVLDFAILSAFMGSFIVFQSRVSTQSRAKKEGQRKIAK